MDGNVNVIVSDGFTGNVALKTAEGTAYFIISELKKAMTGSIIGKISSLLNISNLIREELLLRFNSALFLIRLKFFNVWNISFLIGTFTVSMDSVY